MKFIPLHMSVVRCRPSDGMTKLLNDCGHDNLCARRMAANTNGGPHEDLSRYALSMGTYVGCQWFIHYQGCADHRDPADIKTWRRPDV